MRRRLLIFLHYNRINAVSTYVYYMLKCIRPLYEKLVFISNSPLARNDEIRITSLCSSIHQRKNIGFDFYAWKRTLLTEGRKRLADYDSITIMNDTCFGPLSDMTDIVTSMEAKGVDFWGITNHKHTNSGMPGTNGPVPEHLQSYFLSFEKQVVTSDAFWTFWNGVQCCNDPNLIIHRYETRLTAQLVEKGFNYATYCDVRNIEHGTSSDLTYSDPDQLIEHHHLPFLKVKYLLNANFARFMCSAATVQRCTDYPVKLLFEHAGRMFSPKRILQFLFHTWLVCSGCKKLPNVNKYVLYSATTVFLRILTSRLVGRFIRILR